VSLQCAACRADLAPEAVLSSARHAWPHGWQDFVCPHCGGVGLFEIHGQQLTIGAPDGFPGPCFRVESEQGVPGLVSERNENNDLAVRIGDRQWTIRSRVLRNA